jgi:hypothetical protein
LPVLLVGKREQGVELLGVAENLTDELRVPDFQLFQVLQGPALLRQPAWAGALHWAGAETSASEWGRLDGAVESGRYAAAQVLRQLAGGA